jgi:hypothetical protein
LFFGSFLPNRINKSSSSSGVNRRTDAIRIFSGPNPSLTMMSLKLLHIRPALELNAIRQFDLRPMARLDRTT